MTDLEKAFEECGEQLDRIADALKREKPYIPPIYTTCYYTDGTSNEFNYNDGIIDPVRVNDEMADGKDFTIVEIGSQITSIEEYSFEGYNSITMILSDIFVLDSRAFDGGESVIINCPNNTMAEAQAAGEHQNYGLFGLNENGSSIINCSDGSITV